MATAASICSICGGRTLLPGEPGTVVIRLTTARGTVIEFAEFADSVGDAMESVSGSAIEVMDPSFAVGRWGES